MQMGWAQQSHSIRAYVSSLVSNLSWCSTSHASPRRRTGIICYVFGSLLHQSYTNRTLTANSCTYATCCCCYCSFPPSSPHPLWTHSGCCFCFLHSLALYGCMTMQWQVPSCFSATAQTKPQHSTGHIIIITTTTTSVMMKLLCTWQGCFNYWRC